MNYPQIICGRNQERPAAQVRPSVADSARNHAQPPTKAASAGSVEIRRRRRTQLAVKFNRTRRGIAFRTGRRPPRTTDDQKNRRPTVQRRDAGCRPNTRRSVFQQYSTATINITISAVIIALSRQKFRRITLIRGLVTEGMALRRSVDDDRRTFLMGRGGNQRSGSATVSATPTPSWSSDDGHQLQVPHPHPRMAQKHSLYRAAQCHRGSG